MTKTSLVFSSKILDYEIYVKICSAKSVKIELGSRFKQKTIKYVLWFWIDRRVFSALTLVLFVLITQVNSTAWTQLRKTIESWRRYRSSSLPFPPLSISRLRRLLLKAPPQLSPLPPPPLQSRHPSPEIWSQFQCTWRHLEWFVFVLLLSKLNLFSYILY